MEEFRETVYDMFYDCNKMRTYTLNMFYDRTELMF